MRPQPPRRTTHTTTSPADLIVYDKWGEFGRPVVLLHGLLFDRTMWWPAAADLATTSCTIVAPDLPGHGQSPPREECRIDDIARDLAGLVHRLYLHRAPVLVAHGASARLAAVFADQYAVHHVLTVDQPAADPAAVDDLVTVTDPDLVPAIYRPYARPRTEPAVLSAYRSWLAPPPALRRRPAMAGGSPDTPAPFRHLTEPQQFADEVRALL